MSVSIESIGGLKRRLIISLPNEKIEEQVEARLKKAMKTIRVDGFRPGKVPEKVVRKLYGLAIREEAVNGLLQLSFEEAVAEQGLELAGPPTLVNSPAQEDRSQSVQFIAEVEVFPVVEVQSLEGETFVKKVAELTDVDVNKSIDDLRRSLATWTIVEKPAALGDRVVLDYRGTMNGQEFVGGSADDVPLILGSHTMIAGFEEGVVGLEKGGSKTLLLTFPADYAHKEYAGKEASFHITVKSVEASVLPEVDEAFFKRMGLKEASFEALQTEVRKNLERVLTETIRNKHKQALIDRLIQKTVFDVPETLYKNEIARLKRVSLTQFAQGGQIDETWLSQLPDDLYKVQAEKNVRFGLILSAYVKKNQLKVDDEKVKAMIEQIAQERGYADSEAVVSWYYSNPKQLENIQGLVLEEQVLEILSALAVVTEEIVAYSELTKP